jgi:hypothetical protein
VLLRVIRIAIVFSAIIRCCAGAYRSPCAVSWASSISRRSTLRLIVSGRLSRPPRPLSRSKPNLVANRLERFADQLLVAERAVDLRCV